jgi:hypothetical protein
MVTVPIPPFKAFPACDAPATVAPPANGPASSVDHGECYRGCLSRLGSAQREREPHYRDLGRRVATLLIHGELPDVVLTDPLIEELPPPQRIRRRLGDVLREVELLRKVLRFSERAEQYRALDRRLERQERSKPCRP